MSNLPKVAIILTTFNGEKFIEDQIRSIQDQKNCVKKIFLFDDYSKDSTLSIAEKYNVKINKAKQHLGSASKNFFRSINDIEMSDFDYFCFSDQDDIWKNDRVSNAIKFLEESKSSGYSSAVEAFWEDGKTSILKQSKSNKEFDYLFEGAGQGCTFVMTRNLFKKVKFFCEREEELLSNFHYHDWFVYLVSRCIGMRWYFDMEPSIMYRQHSNNDTGAKNSISGIVRRMTLIMNGWYKDQISIAFTLADIIISDPTKRKKFKKIQNIFFSNSYFIRRIKLIILIFKSGRRKFSDSIILSVAVLLGKL